MGEIVLVVLFAVLVNGGCILSFDRAQRAFRALGAAWVRALATPSPPVPEAADPEPPDDGPPEGEPGAVRVRWVSRLAPS